MSTIEIYPALTEFFRSVFNDGELTLAPAMKPEDIKSWDSHKFVEIILLIEERFDIELSPREVDRLQTVGPRQCSLTDDCCP